MNTDSTIFGGKLMKWLLFGITLFIFAQVKAQPCSNPPTIYLTASGTVICEGNNTRVFFNILGGTPPWRVNYAIDGITQPTVWNITSSPYTLTTGTAGTYTIVDIYDANNCQGSIVGNPVTISVVPLPTVNVGPDFQSCTGFDPILIIGLAQNYSSVLWTSTGNGTFSDPTNIVTLYFPGTNNVSSGHAVLTLTVQPISPCYGAVSDELTVYIDPGATCNAGPDVIHCGTYGYYISGSSATNYSSISWTSSGSGTFLNSNSLNPTYYPSVADLAAGSVVLVMNAYGNGNCLNIPATDDFVLNLTNEPLANAGQAEIICEGSSLQINDASASFYSSLNWSTSGTGSFLNNGSLTPTYTPSNGDINAGSVTLTLTAYPQSPCMYPVTSTKIVTISRIPTVYAGTDGSVCDNSPYNINDAQVSDFTSVLWTTSGSGTFSNPSSINTIYIPSSNDVNNGSVVLTLTAFGDVNCNLSASDDQVLTIIKSPVANAGVDGIACENSTFQVSTASANNYASIQWTTNGTGTLTNANSITPSYVPSHNDALIGTITLTLTLTGNLPCTNTATDAMQLTVTPLPTVYAGTDLSTCSSSAVNLVGASAQNYSSIIWTSSGTGSFSNANTLNPSYTPSAADITNGSVVLSITVSPLAPCTGNVTDNMTLQIVPDPVANAGFDNTSCNGTYLVTGASASNYSSVSWTTSGTGFFTNASTLTPTYTASAQDIVNGFVQLNLTVQGISPCSQLVTDYMVLTLNPAPSANAGLDATICEGTAFQVSTASAMNYSSINWTTSGSGTFSGQSSLYPVYTPSASDILNGSVILTMTATALAPCNNTASDQMTLSFIRSPRANAGPDMTICEGNAALLNGSITNSTSFAWSTSGDGTFTNTSTLTPTYSPGSNDIQNGSVTITLTAYPTGVCLQSHSDNTIVYIGTDPVISAGPDQTTCNNSFTLSSATATDYSSLIWTTSGTGTFINQGFINATYIANQSDIALGSVTLRLTATGIPPCAGLVIDEMVLTLIPQPLVYAGADASTCGEFSYSITDATAQNYSIITWSTSGTGYFSNSASINPTYYPSASDFTAGSVTLTITATGLNLCNTTDSDDMILSFNTQPIVNAGPDISSCGTSPVQITGASATNYNSFYWTHNGSGVLQGSNGMFPTYIPSQNDVLAGQVILTLHATPNAPCVNEVSDEMTIFLEEAPVVNAGADMAVCENQNLVITSASATGYSTMIWTTSGSGTFSNNSIVNPVYFPSAGDIAAGTVTLTLTCTGPAPCNTMFSDNMVLTINSVPIANAGPDVATCLDSYLLSLASATSYSSVNWTSSGTGTFVNASIVDAVYIPSIADRIAGNVILTLTVTGISPCNNVVADDMVLTIGQPVAANAGFDGSTCGTNPFTVTNSSASSNSTITWISSGTGSFVNQTTINPTYTPSPADVLAGSVTLTMHVIGGAPCYDNAQDDMILTISGPSIANAGPDDIICTGMDYTITNASASNYSAIIWSTSGSGTFISGNTLSPTYTPGITDYQNGSVILTLTVMNQGPCSGSVFDEMILTFDMPDSANAGPDAEVCFGENYTVSGASAQGATTINWTASGTGILINATSINPTYIPSAGDQTSGSVILTLTITGSAPCLGTSSDDMTLTINPLPSPTGPITGPAIVCAGETGIVYSINPVQNALTYNWTLPSGAVLTAGDNTPVITVDFGINSVSGFISVTPANDCGNGSPVNFAVTVDPLPSSPGFISGPTSICSNSGDVIYSINPVPNATGYQWSVPTGATIISGNGTNSIVVNFGPGAVSGDVSVNATNNCGSGASSSLAVNVLQSPTQPVITANGPTDFCNGQNVVLSATPGFAGYLWSNGLTTQSITVTASGIFSVVVTDLSGCSSIPSNEITVNVTIPPSPTITASGPLFFCNGGSVTLTASPGYASYLWSSGETTQSINVTQTGSYSVIGIDAAGCQSLPSAQVDVSASGPPAPVITANGPVSFCFGNSVILSAPAGYAGYVWSNGETTQNIIVSVSGNYSVQVVDASGCVSQPSNIITVSVGQPLPAPVITATGPTNLCQGENVTIEAPSGYASYTWSNGATAQNIIVTVSGDYSVIVEDINGCESYPSNIITVSINQPPVANAGADATICTGTSFIVTSSSASNFTSVQWQSSGTGTWLNSNTLNPTYYPSTNDIIIGTVSLTLTASNQSCPDASDVMILSIQEGVIVDAGSDGITCGGSNYNLSEATASLFSTLEWTTSGTGTFSNQGILNPVYTPSPSDIATGSVVLTLTGTSASPCTGTASDNLTLVINQESQVNAGLDGTICAGETYPVTTAVAANYSSLLWTTSGSGFFLNGTTLTPTYIPSQLDVITGNIILTLIGSNPPCSDAIDSQTLTIIPDAFVEAGPDVTICQSCSYTVSGASVNNALNFSWYASGTGTFTNTNTLTPTYQPSQQDITMGSVTLTLIADSYNGCGSTSDQMVIYINQNGLVDFTWDGVCENAQTQFTVDENITPVNAIAYWNWDFGDGLFSNVQNPSHTYNANGSYTVTLITTDTVGNQASASHVVDIRSIPVAFFDIEAPNCLGSETNFTDHSSNEDGYINRWVWNYGDGSFNDTIYFPSNPNTSHSYTLLGTYEVSLSILNSFGCESTYSEQVSITPAPIANFYSSSACEDMNVSFQDASSANGAGNIVSWVWNFGDPSSGVLNTSEMQNPVHLFGSPGIYTVTLYVVNYNNCSDTISKQINVGIAPPVAFTWEATCPNTLSSFFTDPSVVDIGSVATYAWEFGDGGQSNLQDPQHSYNSSGNYTVILSITDTAGCVNTVSNVITVGEAPVAFFSNTEPVCEGDIMEFFNESYSSTGYIVVWEWNFGDGNSVTINYPNSPNTSHQYSTSGTFNVTLTVTNNLGCTNSVIRQVSITPSPIANYSFISACLETPVQFNDMSQANGGGQIISWYWEFGDPASGTGNYSTLQNPTHIFTQAGTYNVVLNITSSNSCTSSISQQVIIAPPPLVDFTSSIGCSGSPVSFVSSQYVNVATTQSWLWNFGDGSTSTEIDPDHTYTSAGTYIVTLDIIDLNGCSATVTHPVSIIPGPMAIFNSNSPGCAGNEVEFNDMSTAIGSAIATWHWDFGDGNDITIYAPENPDVTHIYDAPGAYTATLTVTSLVGCQASVSEAITIINNQTAAFTFNSNCQGTPVQFTDETTSNGGAPITQWLWNFGDPQSGTMNTSTIQNPVHSFTSAGSFTVTLTTTSASGCTDIVSNQIIIANPPAVAFVYSNSCEGLPIQFEPDPTITNIPLIQAWEWNFGDGSPVSNQMNPEHAYNSYGSYDVTLTVTSLDGCINISSQTVDVGAMPVAAFSATSSCVGNETVFTDYSYCITGEPIVAWQWSFGDPSTTGGFDTSTFQNPAYIYDQAGTYFVTLSATTSSGCSSNTTLPVQVVPGPTATFSYSTNACLNGTVTFNDNSYTYMGSISEWQWEFAPNYYSNLQNPVHTFPQTDTCYNVLLTVTDMRGCTNQAIQEVCVPAGLRVDIEYNRTCLGDTTAFMPVLVSPENATLTGYLWNFDDVSSGIHNTSTQTNPVHYFSSPGNYLVSLTTTDINNCSTTSYRNVTVEQLPGTGFTYTVGSCDSTIYFIDQSIPGSSMIETWIWNFGDGITDTLHYGPANISHYYSTTGNFEVTLTTISTSGCSNSFTQAFNKLPCILAGFTQVEPMICQNSLFTFRDESSCGNPIISWEWFFGDGGTYNYTSYQPTVQHMYENDGNFNVTLVVHTDVSGVIVSDTISKSVLVLTSPQADFSANDVCLNATTVLTDESLWMQSEITTWKWDLGDPEAVNDTSTSTIVEYKYPRTGLYQPTLTVTNKYGCSNSVTKDVYIHNFPKARFDYSLSCKNDKTLFTDISDIADTVITKWWWRFKDSVTMLGLAGVQNPHFIFQETGNYEVEQIVIDAFGCSDTTSRTITVNPKPTSAFTITENYEQVQGQVLFTNNSIGADAYEWNFGVANASFEINPVVTFPNDGEYEISLVTYNEFDCPDTLVMTYNLMFKGLWIPNAFSPNNPNEEVRLFKPSGINLRHFMIEVYDTWGNVLWTSNKLDENGSPAEGWNGIFKGNLLPQDTYMWKATAVFKDGTIWDGNNVGNSMNLPEYSYGSVHLIR